MTLTASGLDLETLANMGITQDSAGGHFRIGHDDAVTLGIGGGRWLKNEEKAMLPFAVKGYGALPDGLKDGTYTRSEMFRLAAEAGTNSLPAYGDELTDILDAMAKTDGHNGLLIAYWKHNQGKGMQGYSAETPAQFIEQAVKDAETEQKLLVRDVKETLLINPKVALASALRADYLGKMIEYIKPNLAAITGNGHASTTEAYATLAMPRGRA